MKRSMTVVAALALAILVAGLATQNSYARTATTEQPARATGQQTEAGNFDRAVALMEKHMRVAGDGTLVLDHKALARDIKDGAAKGIEPRTLAELKGALVHTNAALRSDKMEASDVFPTTAADPSNKDTEFTIMGCRGRNGYTTHWWGRRSYLDDCRTHARGCLDGRHRRLRCVPFDAHAALRSAERLGSNLHQSRRSSRRA